MCGLMTCRGEDPAWIHSRVATRRISVSLPVLYDILRTGRVKSFLFKRSPHAQTGRRLIFWPDLERYMQERCAEANRSNQKVWMPIKTKGQRRYIKKEMPAA